MNLIVEASHDVNVLISETMALYIALPTCIGREALVEVGDSVSQTTVCIINRVMGA